MKDAVLAAGNAVAALPLCVLCRRHELRPCLTTDEPPTRLVCARREERRPIGQEAWLMVSRARGSERDGDDAVPCERRR